MISMGEGVSETISFPSPRLHIPRDTPHENGLDWDWIGNSALFSLRSAHRKRLIHLWIGRPFVVGARGGAEKGSSLIDICRRCYSRISVITLARSELSILVGKFVR